ncbi:excinuclease ABC subunit UvrC [Roseospira visakhapatnamensis]|uniref:UvrABC system protein C n=1 Tax=Roseospira visakhapatnamensis TaxID=390880 RepID=A0A7W6W993_9PROT|nr:excinuclease ABC subunit UvrC [Roseospira visakhapatnamensis]MBB4265865.1 excinuclease ABC subunit C [Roseospira visakhapatnamensis]
MTQSLPQPAEATPDPTPNPGDPAPDDGVAVILATWRTLPNVPGVYRMLDRHGDALYVGKARDLRKRVVTYTRPERLPPRLRRMVATTARMEIVTTHTEAEALLLESNLIKKLKPRFNILLRDDKSFPFILLTGDHAYPQVVKHRGPRSRPGRYHGPFASAGAVNRTLVALQKAFLLRSCSDTVFANRSRPCLLFQIKRCCAPCVDRIDRPAYDALVDQARAFLEGRSQDLQRDLARRMEEASARLAFEEAADYRDRIRALTTVQAHQDIALPGLGEADVIGLHQAGGQTCVQVFFFRAGANHGNRAYFPTHARDDAPGTVLEAFLGQFYARQQPPKAVLLSEPVPNAALVEEALCIRADRRVRLLVPQRGDRRKVVDHAVTNAREALARRLAETGAQRTLLEGLAEVLGLEAPPERVEVYDNSHISGTNPVGGMIVAGPEGFQKNAYRTFNIRQAETTADDYAMMREVMERRFGRALKEDPERARGQWPDLVLIDGGQGQLSAALGVLADLGIEDLPLVGIAKGPDRDAGRERFFMSGKPSFLLPPNHPVLYFVQRLRDEAHRFAIGTHRARRKKSAGANPLDGIPGIGATRKRALMHHFGSAKAVSQAGLADLEAVDGISAALARTIYESFHGAGDRR